MQLELTTKFLLLIVFSLLVVCYGENNKTETLKLMPMSMQTHADKDWPSGYVLTYSEDDLKRKDCLTVAQILGMDEEVSIFKRIMDKLGVLEELERSDIPNFTILVPSNQALINFIKRLEENDNLEQEVDYNDIESILNSIELDQWDTAIAILILPETWTSFNQSIHKNEAMKTLESRDAFYWRFRTLEDGSVRLRFEFQSHDEKVSELVRPVLVGIIYGDIRTCNGWLHVIDSMPF